MAQLSAADQAAKQWLKQEYRTTTRFREFLQAAENPDESKRKSWSQIMAEVKGEPAPLTNVTPISGGTPVTTWASPDAFAAANPDWGKTTEGMMTMIGLQRAQNEALKSAKSSPRNISFKVSEKGALSAYGLGRFPVTLYREQWERLLAMSSEIAAFIQANSGRLTTKEQSDAKKAA